MSKRIEFGLNFQEMIISWLLGEVWSISTILGKFCHLGMPESCPNLPKILVLTITVKKDWSWLKLSGNDHFMVTRWSMVHFDHFGQILPPGHAQNLPNLPRKWFFLTITLPNQVKFGWNFQEMFILWLGSEWCSSLGILDKICVSNSQKKRLQMH